MNQDDIEAGRNPSGGARPQETRYDVFLSYSHKDAELYGKELIQSIKDGIEAELFTITCRSMVFLDSEALNYGDEWHAKIMEKLNECRVFICLLSDNYLNSSYCTRERLWWERKEIQDGRLRKDTLPVYYIRLKNDDLYSSENRKIKDLAGFQMKEKEEKLKPWFDGGMEEVKADYLKARIEELKGAVRLKYDQATTTKKSFNTVFPPPTKVFTGRILELKELREICAASRYPVIEGEAGIGKTELAAVYSYGYAEEYPQGRFLIHMEGKRSWQDAVLSLVLDEETGHTVQAELSISDEDMKGEKEKLHRQIIEKLFARAEHKRLLLVLDNVDDASLFTDKNLLCFSRNQPIPDNIHMIATTRHRLDFPNNQYKAQVYHLNGLDEDASFELFCEIGGNMFPFCRRPVLSLDSDPEYMAAMEIIHQLGGHVWSLEIIAGQIANKYDDGVTFQKRLESLNKKYLIREAGGGFRNKASDPVELLSPTLGFLRERKNGPAIIQLAYFAALLPPDGKKRDVLERCWKKHFSNLKFDDGDEDVDPFLYSFNQLWRRHLLQNADGSEKMHRLTQAALKKIMEKEGAFDRTVQMLADVLVESPGFTVDRWIDLMSSTHEVAQHLNKAHHSFFLHLLSPGSWTMLLLNDYPFFSKLCPWETITPGLDGEDWVMLLKAGLDVTEQCPWDKLNGEDWGHLLRDRPQFAEKCNWDKLDGADWCKILCDQPEFENKCVWDKLEGGDWAEILRVQPQLEKKCPWDGLNGYDWEYLLSEQPQFAGKCNWDKLSGWNWSNILQNQPSFAALCQWDKLEGFDWVCLLSEQPQFAALCQWDKLEGRDWASLLSEQPQFAEKCSWDKLNGKDWSRLLQVQLQFADKCQWDKLNVRDWVCLLSEQPLLDDECPCDRLNGWSWSVILQYQPSFASLCRWDKLEGSDWVELLKKQPQFAENCPWNMLDRRNWVQLLQEQPQFASLCCWDKLEGSNWVELLEKQPQFTNQCPWDKLEGGDWVELLQEQPQFADLCQWDKLDGSDWVWIWQDHPQFADKCQWNKLEGRDWVRLLQDHTQFADKCQWDKLEGRDWVRLLREKPQFIKKISWDKLSGKDWGMLSAVFPQLVRKIPWDKFTGHDWAFFLSEQPQFADKCTRWDEMDGHDWTSLLQRRPQFAEKCPWDKLNGFDWATLLSFRPQFAEKCSWDKLNGKAWSDLLQVQMQFAEKCTWDKLNGDDWVGLLDYRPQFAEKCSWDKLTEEDWAKLLANHPKSTDGCPWNMLTEYLTGEAWGRLLAKQPWFADRCDNWKKLKGKDWAALMGKQPQFADKCDWNKLSKEDWTELLMAQPQFAEKCPFDDLKG